MILQLSIALAFAALVEALSSLKRGADLLRFFESHRQLPPPISDAAPPATLVVAFRGLDPGLAENLRAIFRLDYDDLEILLVTGDRADPCVPMLDEVVREHPEVRTAVLFAGRAKTRGQKVHNLLHAVANVRAESQVLAFADSDARPGRRWLRELVVGLDDPRVGATTGYRWYVRSALTRTIAWRGIRYRMVSPTKTVVLSREQARGLSR